MVLSGQSKVVLALTWLAHGSTYLMKKSMGATKATMQAALGLSIDELGDLDTAFLAMYAVSQIPSGAAADRFGPRLVLTAGLLLAAMACLATSVVDGVTGVVVLGALNGVGQAASWPSCIKALTAWFEEGDRGRVMGLWATNYQVFGILGSVIAGCTVAQFGWRAAFAAPGALTLLVVVAVFTLMPRGEGLSAPTKPRDGTPSKDRTSLTDVALKPGVWVYSVSYFFLKLMRYSFLFWLPYYLSSVEGYTDSTATYIATAMELGGMVGVMAIGAWGDRAGAERRVHLTCAVLFALAVSLGVYHLVASPVVRVAVLTVLGFLLYGADTLIAGTGAQDVGGESGAASAAAIINTIGSGGAFFQGRTTSGIVSSFGWQALYQFYAATLLLAAGILLLVPKPSPRPKAD
eukprot:Sspe_Gene.96154::Locus_68616_Transcript_1_4_Confidence_0.500_Length_1317::g.96154::m.96154